MEVAGVEANHLVERHVVRVRLAGEVVVPDEDEPRLDPQRLDGGEAVGHGSRVDELAPKRRRVAWSTEDLVPELARVARPRHPCGDAADADLPGEEAEVREPADVCVAEACEQLTRPRALQLDVRQLRRDRLDLDLEPVDDLLEVRQVGIERRDHPSVLVVELEHRAVADHLPAVVAERRVAHLPDFETDHVVGEDPIGGTERVRSAEVPFAQRRLVPDASILPDGPVLCDGVTEVVGPLPPLPVHELAAHAALDGVEGRANDLGAHLSTASLTRPAHPSSSETSRACCSSGSTTPSIA